MDGGFQGIYVEYLGGGGFLVGALFGISAFSELPGHALRLGASPAAWPAPTLPRPTGCSSLNYIGFALTRAPLLIPLTIIKGVGFGFYS